MTLIAQTFLWSAFTIRMDMQFWRKLDLRYSCLNFYTLILATPDEC